MVRSGRGLPGAPLNIQGRKIVLVIAEPMLMKSYDMVSAFTQDYSCSSNSSNLSSSSRE